MLARYFIDRPVFATVISIVIVILGLVALTTLPIAQYPEIVPPTIQVIAAYPGANAQVVADTVAAPLEQEINGVEGMLYMSSKCGNDGVMTLDITFRLGTDLNQAQVLVQNRVSIAEPRLPDETKRLGITTKKRSSSILLVVNLISPDGSQSQLSLSNAATLYVKDVLARLEGVGDVNIFGVRDYSMRVWLDPGELADRNMNAADVVAALRQQNVQVAAGRVGQAPSLGTDLQLAVNTQGRLMDAAEFGGIIVKTGELGQLTRLRDVARVELGARNYDANNFLYDFREKEATDGAASSRYIARPSVGIAIFQRPGSNALRTAERVKEAVAGLRPLLRNKGIDYRIVYDTTVFVEESVASVYHTLIEAFVLVFVVVLIFLQDWRATILPMIDVPVSLIGTFAVMSLFGFTLNNLTLFGLVLAIGIVVDDAIVVLENIETWLERGYSPREATIKAMDEVTGPIIAITLVLCSVFIPTAFLEGITGQFYRQFALTIAASTVISAINAMTMTPSRAVQIFEASARAAAKAFGSKSGGTNIHAAPHAHAGREALPWWGLGLIIGWLAWHFLGERLLAWWGLPFPSEHGVLAGPQAGDSQGIVQAAGDLDSGAERGTVGWIAPWLPSVVRIAFLVAGLVPAFWLASPVNRALAWFFRGFNLFFAWIGRVYGAFVRGLLRIAVVPLVIYGGLLVLTWLGFRTVPSGFVPGQDKGYLIVAAQLPDGASLDRTERVMDDAAQAALKIPGVTNAISIPGFSLLTGSNLSNAGTMFLTLAPFEERRRDPGRSGPAILGQLYGLYSNNQDAVILPLNAPPVDGIGNSGGIKLQVQDQVGQGPAALQGVAENLTAEAMESGMLVGGFSTFRANEPQIYLDFDRTKAMSAGIGMEDINATLGTYLGSTYANDFTYMGRSWQVNVQADAPFRMQAEDIRALKVRNRLGEMAPLGALVDVREVTGPSLITRYNMFPSADLNGIVRPGVSSGQAMRVVERVAANVLPQGMSYEWTELSLQEKLTGNTAAFVFVLGAVFVYLVLASLYESWILPLAIILILPMCLFAAIAGIWWMRGENNVFTQIGLVVLIGLASKNAILIVEFARELRRGGKSLVEATVEASRARLRPIVMTSAAFILGVVPLVRATGAGAEMRYALGLAVFSGMLGVTLFGLGFTPLFYWALGRLSEKK